MFVSAAAIVTASFGQCQSYNAGSVGAINCGALGYPPALGLAIDANGSSAGYYHNCDVQSRAFRWPSGGVFTPIVFSEDISYARAIDISAAGLVVGDVDIVGVSGRKAFQSIGGVTTYLPPLPGQNSSEAHGVNAAGVVVGMSTYSQTRAVFWSNGVPTALDLPVGPSAVATDINDASQICGYMGQDPYPIWGASPFVWHNGVTTTLPLPVNAMNNSGGAVAINNLATRAACTTSITPAETPPSPDAAARGLAVR